MHRDCMQTCTNRALVVRFEDSTAPYKTGNQRSNCVIPANAGPQLQSENAQIRRRRRPECSPNALGLHSTMHSWCVSKTPRHPTGQATSVRMASFPRRRESSLSETGPDSAQKDASGTPGMHCTCTKYALVVRFEDFTAPYKTANLRWYWGIPAQAGIHRLSETGPISAQTDARVHPECTGSAFKRASNTHWWCVSKAPRRPANQPTKESCGRCSDAPTSSLRRMTLSSSLVNDGTRRGRSPVICSG